jgi:hypothetical protein
MCAFKVLPQAPKWSLGHAFRTTDVRPNQRGPERLIAARKASLGSGSSLTNASRRRRQERKEDPRSREPDSGRLPPSS